MPDDILQSLRGSDGCWRTLIQQNSDAILVVADDGLIRFANPAAEEFLGGPDLVGRPFPLPLPATATKIEIPGGRGTQVAELRVVGVELDGQPARLIVLRDFTQRQRTAEAVDFMVEASHRLAQVHDPATTAATVAELIASRLADWCVIDLLDDSNKTVQRAAAAHTQAAFADRIVRLQASGALSGAWPHKSRLPTFLSQPQIFNEVSDDIAELLAGESAPVELVRQLGCHAVLVAPLVARGRVLGAIWVVSAVPSRKFTSADLTLVIELGYRMALTLEHARMCADTQASVQRRDEFLAMLAHELRNPLAAIQNAVDVMKVDGVRTARQQRVHDVIERQGEHMARLLDDLLDIARVTRGRIELRRRVLDLGQIIQDAIQTCRQLIAARGHELTLASAAEPVWVDADPIRLSQVVVNLLNNAAKYTEPGGQIHLEAKRAGAEAIIRVRDTGIGIAPSDLLSVFDLFVQGEHTLARSDGGLGIGLTLVRKLVEMHGGSVTAFSEGKNHGSEFLVRLPVVPEPADIHRTDDGDSQFLKRRIVVVEDNADAREMLQCLLSLEGHEVEVAADGVRGIETILRSQPDIAFVDIGLPGVDGYQVAQRVRAADTLRAIRLIALTGYGQAEDAQRALAAGFDRHLVKPVKLEALADVLQGSDAARS